MDFDEHFAKIKEADEDERGKLINAWIKKDTLAVTLQGVDDKLSPAMITLDNPLFYRALRNARRISCYIMSFGTPNLDSWYQAQQREVQKMLWAEGRKASSPRSSDHVERHLLPSMPGVVSPVFNDLFQTCKDYDAMLKDDAAWSLINEVNMISSLRTADAMDNIMFNFMPHVPFTTPKYYQHTRLYIAIKTYFETKDAIDMENELSVLLFIQKFHITSENIIDKWLTYFKKKDAKLYAKFKAIRSNAVVTDVFSFRDKRKEEFEETIAGLQSMGSSSLRLTLIKDITKLIELLTA